MPSHDDLKELIGPGDSLDLNRFLSLMSDEGGRAQEQLIFQIHEFRETFAILGPKNNSEGDALQISEEKIITLNLTLTLILTL